MDIQSYIGVFLGFINDMLMPLLLAVAVLVFIWNMFRYAFVGGLEEESRAKARSLMLWGILAFVVIAGIWGIVAIVSGLFGFDNRSIIPDYVCERGDGWCKGEGSTPVDNYGDFNEPVNFDQVQTTS